MLLGDRHWADAEIDSAERHRLVFDRVRGLEEQQSYIAQRNLQHAWLYDRNCMLMGLGGQLQYSDAQTWLDQLRDKGVVENVIASIVDTATATIARHRPRGVYLTDGGNHRQKHQARDATRYMEGLFEIEKVHAKRVVSFLDKAVVGTGVMHVYADKPRRRPRFERVVGDEFWVDEEACRHAEPREVFRRKFADKRVLLRQPFVDTDAKREAIMGAHVANPAYTSYRAVGAGQVVLIVAHQLPSGPGADDGRITVAVDGATLYDETYTKDYLPYVWGWWSRRYTGFYGIGIPERIATIQSRLNYLYAKVAQAQDLVAVPRVFMHQNDAKAIAKLNNKIGAIYPLTTGRPPTFLTPTAMSSEMYSQIEQLKADAYRLAGISEMTAHATREPGIEAGIALRELRDIQTTRFAIQEQGEEDYVRDLCRLTNRICREMQADGVELITMYRDRRGVKRVEFPDLDDEAFVMSVEAGSMLSRGPSGRLSMIMDLLAVAPGAFTPKQILRMVQHPDVQAELDLETAEMDLSDWIVERLERGETVTPEPHWPLAELKRRVLLSRDLAQAGEADEDATEAMATFVELLKVLEDQATAGADTPALPPGPAPPGPPPAPDQVPEELMQAMGAVA